MHILQAKNISKSYSNRAILSKLSLAVEEGEVLAIMGASGAGKSTLLRIIAGIEPFNEGQVLFEGDELEDPTDMLVPGHEELRYVAQDFKLLKNRSVLENVKEALLAYTDDFRDQQLDYLLNTLQLVQLKDKRIELLSGGEKQRLAIARAMATEPQVLLLDEPFTQLDQVNRSIIIKAIKSVNEKLGTTVVFVTHQAEEVFQLANRVGVLVDSHLVQIDKPQKVYEKAVSLSVASLFSPVNMLNISVLKKLGVGVQTDKIYGIRPQHLHISTEKKEGSIPTNIQEISFNGAYSNVVVDVQEGFVVHAPIGEFKKGEKVYLSINKSALMVWDKA